MYRIICLMLAVALSSSVLAQKEKLRLNLVVGETYRQKTNSNVEVLQDIQGQQMKINMTVIGSMSFKVTAFANALYSMEVQYDDLLMKMVMPGGTLDFSSEKDDPNDVFSGLLRSIKAKPFQVTMTPSGTIKEVKNIDILFESMFEAAPNMPEQQRKQIKDQLMKAYGEDAFRGNLEMVTSIYSEDAVAPGDTWVKKTRLESGMAADIETVYKYKESNGEFVLISGDSKLATADKDAYVEANGMPIRYDLAGTMISDIRVHRKSGWIKEAKLTQALKGTAYIKDTPQVPGGMSIPMSMNNGMVITD